MGITSVSIVMTVVVLNFHYCSPLNKRELPKWLKRWLSNSRSHGIDNEYDRIRTTNVANSVTNTNILEPFTPYSNNNSFINSGGKEVNYVQTLPFEPKCDSMATEKSIMLTNTGTTSKHPNRLYSISNNNNNNNNVESKASVESIQIQPQLQQQQQQLQQQQQQQVAESGSKVSKRRFGSRRSKWRGQMGRLANSFLMGNVSSNMNRANRKVHNDSYDSTIDWSQPNTLHSIHSSGNESVSVQYESIGPESTKSAMHDKSSAFQVCFKQIGLLQTLV